MFFRPLLLALLAITVLASACRKQAVTSYRIPKEKAPAVAAASAGSMPAPAAVNMAATAVPTAGGESLVWTVPANWKTGPAAAMRKATYLIAGEGGATAELSITAFPNDVGGEAANLNRWRGQVKLPPMADAELAGQVTRSTSHGLAIAMADFSNPAVSPSPGPQRILGAIVPFQGATWFFKLTGPDALLAQEKPAFLAFLQSVKPAGAP